MVAAAIACAVASTVPARAVSSSAAATPAIPIIGDFDGNGTADIVSYTPGSGADHLWYATGFGLVRGPDININGTYSPVSGDFNGDSRDDIFWYDIATPSHSSVWYGAPTGQGFVHSAPINAPASTAADIYVPMSADFDGDGKSDIVWGDLGPGHRGTTMGSPIWYGAATGFSAAVRPLATVPCAVRVGCTVAATDFNGDGKDDLFFYRFGLQPDKIWYSTGPSFAGDHTSVKGVYVMVVGDFNGDGRSDVVWYGPGHDADNLWYGTLKGFVKGTSITINGDYLPVVGDFNGDGDSDIVWYTPGTGPDYLNYGQSLRFRNGPSIVVNGRYDPVAGDFNGDGKDDIVWFAQNGDPSYVWYGADRAAHGFQSGPPTRL